MNMILTAIVALAFAGLVLLFWPTTLRCRNCGREIQKYGYVWNHILGGVRCYGRSTVAEPE